MKKSLYLYLFIFALLTNVFTYMYFTNKQKFEDSQVKKMEEKVKTVKDSMQAFTKKMADADYFSLENNRNALAAFEGQDIAAIDMKIRDGIYAQNVNPKGNPLVGYPAMDGGKIFTISKIKILNNKWVIVDFSNGLRWGEAIIKYFIEEDGKVTYEIAETHLYNFVPY
ncbi:hypothetical protein D3C87_158470 [compost metagenome]